MGTSRLSRGARRTTVLHAPYTVTIRTSQLHVVWRGRLDLRFTSSHDAGDCRTEREGLDDMTEAVRAPEERFADLPDFAYAPHWREVDGLRLAHLDEGDGAPVLLVHGEPTGSYLWRHVTPPLRDAGFRCIAPDHAGFGRSDKPSDLGWYS